MPRKKLNRMLAVDSLPNVFHYNIGDSTNSLHDFFQRDLPLTLEIGCGRGDYSLNLAARFPDRNFIGVDIKGARLCTGAKNAISAGSSNVAFLRARAEALTRYFKAGQVDEIWIPFPDPQPKKKGEKKRLTAPALLTIYRTILKRGGRIHLKTDDRGFWDYTLATISTAGFVVDTFTDDLYHLNSASLATEIQTKYEQKHLAAGRTIKYVCFRFEPD